MPDELEELEAAYCEAILDNTIDGRRRARELAADPRLARKHGPLISPERDREAVDHVRAKIKNIPGTEAELDEQVQKARQRLQAHREGPLAKALARERELEAEAARAGELPWERKQSLRSIRSATQYELVARATEPMRRKAGLA